MWMHTQRHTQRGGHRSMITVLRPPWKEGWGGERRAKQILNLDTNSGAFSFTPLSLRISWRATVSHFIFFLRFKEIIKEYGLATHKKWLECGFLPLTSISFCSESYFTEIGQEITDGDDSGRVGWTRTAAFKVLLTHSHTFPS